MLFFRRRKAVVSEATNDTAAPVFTGSGRDYLKVKVSDIKHSRCNTRHGSELTPSSLQPLAATMLTVGLLHPIILERRADGELQVIAGRRRLEAAAILGWQFIDAIVVNRPTANMAFLIENEQRRNLHCVTRAHATAVVEGQTRPVAR